MHRSRQAGVEQATNREHLHVVADGRQVALERRQVESDGRQVASERKQLKRARVGDSLVILASIRAIMHDPLRLLLLIAGA